MSQATTMTSSGTVASWPFFIMMALGAVPVHYLMFLSSYSGGCLLMFGLLSWTVLTTALYARETQKPVLTKTFASPIILLALFYFGVGLFFFTKVATSVYIVLASFRLAFGLAPLLIASLTTVNARQCIIGLLIHIVVGLSVDYYCLSVAIKSEFGYTAGDRNLLHRNTLGDLCASGLIAAWCLFLSVKPKRFRVALLSLAAIHLLGMLATMSRGSILSAAVGLFAVMFVKGVSLKKQVVSGILFAVALTGIVLLLPEERLQERTNMEMEHSSAGARPQFWSVAVDFIGSRNFQPVGWEQPYVNVKTGEKYLNISNVWLQDIIETGFLGFAAHGAFFILSIVLALKNKALIAAKSPWLAVNAIAAALIIQRHCHGLVDNFWNTQSMFMSFVGTGLLVNISRRLQDKNTT